MNILHFLNEWVALITLAASLGTAAAAIAAWRSSNAAKKGIQAQILMEAYTEYASTEMVACISKLRDYKESAESNFALLYYEKKDSNEIIYSEVESSRRIVSHYFHKIAALQKAGIIKKKFVNLLITGDQAAILFELVEPLDGVQNPNYDLDPYNLFRELNKEESDNWKRYYLSKTT